MSGRGHEARVRAPEKELELQEGGSAYRWVGPVPRSVTRIDVAKRRMLDSDAALKLIALDVGFASPQQFSTVFRRIVGEAPSAWRERHSPKT